MSRIITYEELEEQNKQMKESLDKLKDALEYAEGYLIDDYHNNQPSDIESWCYKTLTRVREALGKGTY